MNSPKLLTRDNFRESVFARDNYTCVFCSERAVDAHHILERRLWTAPDQLGGYFIENGISVCEYHHLACERTDISVEEARLAANIQKKVIPEHLYGDQEYTKWGDPILQNGKRLRGELFFDESVQKIIIGHIARDQYTHWVKYPRTYHLPWSPGLNDDDRVVKSLAGFEGKRVIVTKKMDGENTTMYSDYIHARSLDGRHHVSRDWVKQYWSSIAYNIPTQWRLIGENLFAKHSISYSNLKTYFYGFQIWNDQNYCLSWDETLEYFQLLDVHPVEVLYDGIWDERKIRDLEKSLKWDEDEGYVVRTADGFHYGQFRHAVAKFVRKDHIQTIKHWMHGQELVKNELEKI